jgi:hypothetical protein
MSEAGIRFLPRLLKDDITYYFTSVKIMNHYDRILQINKNMIVNLCIKHIDIVYQKFI